MSAIGKCPWPGCGGVGSITRHGLPPKHPGVWIMCDKCDACGPSETDVTAAITAWNRLATPGPERVTGRVRWEGDCLKMGNIPVGHVHRLPTDREWWRLSGIAGVQYDPTDFRPTEASARAALVAAVKEAIGDADPR